MGSRAGLPSRAAGKAQTSEEQILCRMDGSVAEPGEKKESRKRKEWRRIEGCEGAVGTNAAPAASGLMGERGSSSQNLLPDLMVDGGNCWSSTYLSLGCIQTRIPAKSALARMRPCGSGEGRQSACHPLGVTWSRWGQGPRTPPVPASAQGREGREEEKETDGQRWKHKLTRRKRINSRQGADPSTYAVPQPARHREVSRHSRSPSPQRGPSRAGGRQREGGEGSRLRAKTLCGFEARACSREA